MELRLAVAGVATGVGGGHDGRGAAEAGAL
eukprot:COSAG01_NODE_4251_length_5207_cov_2.521339_7_plen_30_part_00